jgi:flagellar export protein FliJ
MPRKFHFRLAPLLRLHEATRNECRAKLAEAYHAEEILRGQAADVERGLMALKQECRDRSQPGLVDVDRLIDSQRYEFLLLAQRETLKQHAAALAVEIERRREALVAADREVKILEKLRETQRAQHQKDEERQEFKRMDEVAARTHAGERD